MFCTDCGTKLPDNAKFCFNCGKKISDLGDDSQQNNVTNGTGTKLVNAKCTNCGAKLEVNPDVTKAKCSYCDAEFIVEQAINNYNIQVSGNMNINQATINVQGINKENLLARAKDFEEKHKLDEALDYYNRVLDIDFSDEVAKKGATRVKNIITDFVYCDEEIPGFFSKERKLVKKDALHVIDSKGKEKAVYYYEKMSKLKITWSVLTFMYDEKKQVNIGGGKNKEILSFIENAQKIGRASCRERV